MSTSQPPESVRLNVKENLMLQIELMLLGSGVCCGETTLHWAQCNSKGSLKWDREAE